MPGEITRVEHRHGDQKATDPDLVVEVGRSPPPFYQRQGRLVVSIEGDNPLRCRLNDGDVILIGQHKVSNITRA